MKKTTLFSLIGLLLWGNLFAEDYDTVVQRNGTKFQIMLAPKERISLGTYDVPVELSDKQARDMIEGKMDGLEITNYAGTIPKEIFLLDFVDCYQTDTYKYVSVAGGIKSKRSVQEVNTNFWGIFLIVLFGFIIPTPFLFFLGLPGEYSSQSSEPLKRIAFSLSVFLAAIIIMVGYSFWSNPSGLLVVGESFLLAILAGMISNTFSAILAVFFSAFTIGALANFTGSLGASYYGLIEYIALMAFVCLCSFGFWWHKARTQEKQTEPYAI